MKIIDDEIIFSSGRCRNANMGIIGIGPKLNVTGGYDDGLYSDELEEFIYDDQEILRKDDLVELADHMIMRWKKFKAKYKRSIFTRRNR